MQHDLESLSAWLSNNNLKLNVTKTKSMLFTKDGLFPNIELKIENELVESVKTFKFLGITLDNALRFDVHHSIIYKRLQSSCSLLRNLCKNVSLTCLKQLYYAYFDSYLMYGLFIWYPLLIKQHQNSLYLLQKRIIRILTGANFHQHCMPLFKKESILTIPDNVKLQNCKLVFALDRDVCPMAIQNLFEVRNHTCATRSTKISLMKHKTDVVNKSFLCKPISDWQSLSNSIKETE